MLLPVDLAKWMDACGVPLGQNTVSTGGGYVSITPALERIILNGTLVFSFLRYLGQKAKSRDMIEKVQSLKLSPGDSQFVVIDNWAQLFPVLHRMGICKSEESQVNIYKLGFPL